MNKLITLSAITAVILSVFLYCSKDLSTSSDTTSIAPRIIWKTAGVQSIPSGIDSVRITISSASLDIDMVKTFAYEDNQGTITSVPAGISITIKIEGIDSTGAVAYYGFVEVAEVVAPTMEITIEAHQVTPFAPSNLVANELSFDKIRLIWADNSSNEDYFIVYIYNITNSTYDSIAQITSNSYTDTGLIQLKTYQYLVKACNQAGYSNQSNSASATTMFLDNTGPTIIVESHTDPDTVNKRTITLYGKVTDTSGIFQFFVNNLLADLNDDLWMVENFYLPDTLANQIILNATDNSVFKNVSQDTITVVYKEDYVDTTNNAPVFTVSSSDLEATVKAGKEYEKILTAIDQDDNDSMWFEVSTKLTISIDTIRWTPQISDTGVNNFYALVKDRKLAKDLISWTITVLDTGSNVPNTPPEFITQVADIEDSIVKNNQYLDTLKAQDVDEDSLTYSKVSGPTDLLIGSKNGIINWTPSDTGKFNVIARVADDSAAYDEIAWTIIVISDSIQQNNPPQFITDSSDMKDSIILGQIYKDTVEATDPDVGDILKYSLINGPVSVDSVYGIVTWTPSSAGKFNVTVRVTDDSSAYEDLTWSITVVDTNHTPVFTSIPSDMEDTAYVNTEYKDTVHATDIDGDVLTFSFIDSVTGMVLTDSIITWTPNVNDTGSNSVSVQVSDGNGGYDTLSWTIAAIDTTVIKPDITDDPQPVTVNVGQTATFGVVATGTKPFAYKWQKNGADISGGTDSSFTTPATIIGDSGSTFRCIVSNSAGGDTSAAALLKVTSGTIVTDIDGNVYQTVMIGSQVWTVENLRTTKYNDGTAIPYVTDNSAWANLTTPGYCYYGNDSAANAVKYGALYNWYVVETGKLAPAGWHVPDSVDWDILQNYLIANGYNWDGTTTGNKIGKSMAAKTDWNSSATEGDVGNNLSSNNSSGFSSLPGGGRNNNGSFGNIGGYGDWWSSTERNATSAYFCRLSSHHPGLNRDYDNKEYGIYVRLVKD